MVDLNPGDVVTFTEYDISQLTGRRRVRQRMENMLLEAVILPNECLRKDKIEEYFGEDLTPDVCRQLSRSPATRLILNSDDDHRYCVEVSDYFLQNGLQTIETSRRAVPEANTAAPNYLQFLSAFEGQ